MLLESSGLRVLQESSGLLGVAGELEALSCWRARGFKLVESLKL